MNQLAQTLLVFLNDMQRSFVIYINSLRKQNKLVEFHHVNTSELGKVAFDLILSQSFKIKLATNSLLVSICTIKNCSEFVYSSSLIGGFTSQVFCNKYLLQNKFIFSCVKIRFQLLSYWIEFTRDYRGCAYH